MYLLVLQAAESGCQHHWKGFLPHSSPWSRFAIVHMLMFCEILIELFRTHRFFSAMRCSQPCWPGSDRQSYKLYLANIDEPPLSSTLYTVLFLTLCCFHRLSLVWAWILNDFLSERIVKVQGRCLSVPVWVTGFSLLPRSFELIYQPAGTSTPGTSASQPGVWEHFTSSHTATCWD